MQRGDEEMWRLIDGQGSDECRMGVSGQVAYPFPVAGAPRVLGNGNRCTVTEWGDALHVWALRGRNSGVLG
ncbi:hypothetical protein GCM10010381_37480 [Streptomyces xantholiticus]|nr:hypothetical protein GCM10010381_37480 [Streptomyces xantholiticus]